MMIRIAIVFLLPVLLVFSGCRKETEEDRVRKVVTSVQKAAENKEIRTVLDHLSKSYQDPQGNNYDGIKGLLTFYFFRHPKVSVYIPGIDVTIDGAAAAASFQAVLTGRTGEPGGTVLPESLGVYTFNVDFKKEEGRWKVVSATWERTGERGP